MWYSCSPGLLSDWHVCKVHHCVLHVHWHKLLFTMLSYTCLFSEFPQRLIKDSDTCLKHTTTVWWVKKWPELWGVLYDVLWPVFTWPPLEHYLCGDFPCEHCVLFVDIIPVSTTTLYSMTHSDITEWVNDIARDVHCDITMSNDVAMTVYQPKSQGSITNDYLSTYQLDYDLKHRVCQLSYDLFYGGYVN